MVRDPSRHLSPEEFWWLGNEKPETLPVDRTVERGEAAAHAGSCSVCGPRLRAQRSIQAGLRVTGSPVPAKPKSGCPAEEKWAAMAGGTLSDAEAAPFLAHASTCDHCGVLLRSVLEDMNPEISPEEQDLIRSLRSATPLWQARLAQQMAHVSGHETEKRPLRGRTLFRWFSPAWLRWAAVPVVIALVVFGVALWIPRYQSLATTNRLISRAYTQQRPFEMRFAEASYGPLRQRRGEQTSHLDESPDLLDAESRIARALARQPHSPEWLHAKARTDLLEGNYQSAIDALKQAQGRRPDDDSLKLDLAIAYHERAGSLSDGAARVAANHLALQLLDEILSDDPISLVALFNRALIYQQVGRTPDSVADWQHYLQLDGSGAWAEEAKAQLARLNRRADR